MIYYLVQSEAYQYADRMAEMANSGAEVIFLTWDKQIDGALFLPNSTWAQGRNFLIKHVLDNGYNFYYLVLMDGDAKPIKGSWKEFNDFLLTKIPQICLPLMLRADTSYLYRLMKWLSLSFLAPSQQRAIVIDEQVQAFRKDVILAVGKYIYPKLFDTTSWWCNSAISQEILKYLTPYNIVQFNKLVIENKSHLSYPHAYDAKFMRSYLKNLGLYSLLPFPPLNHIVTYSNNFVRKLIVLLNSFIELLHWIPFPIKEFDVAKRAEYVKQCLQKMKTINIKESKKAEDCINT